MARRPLDLLPRGSALQRRVLLAELLGPPRSRAPWRPPSARDDAPEPPPPPAEER